MIADLNGRLHTPPTTKPQLKPKAKPTPKPAKPRPWHPSWPLFGVAFTAVLSAGLNGYANAQHAPYAWAGWLMGLAVPVLVLVLAKVAGEAWVGKRRLVAYLAGGSGVALLFLSVWHCGNSIALLTGGSLWLSMPMSVAIDCGLVACEVALVAGGSRK